MLDLSNDGSLDDGLTLQRLMQSTKVLHQSKRGKSMNFDEILSKITYNFEKDDTKTFFSVYRTQIVLFNQIGMYELPEEYHYDHITTS